MWAGTEKIPRVQIELTNYCNARCNMCEREQVHNGDMEGGAAAHLNNAFVTIKDIEQAFSGDWSMLSKLALIATNGGARDEEFWTRMGKISYEHGCEFTVIFGIDGLEDTNHLYRKNVKWDVLQRNFRAYISAGGTADWQFIPFSWNKHQLDEARELAVKEGFRNFVILDSIRGEKE